MGGVRDYSRDERSAPGSPEGTPGLAGPAELLVLPLLVLLTEALLLGDLVVELYHLGGGDTVELHEGSLGEGSLLLLRQREVGWKQDRRYLQTRQEGCLARGEWRAAELGSKFS